MLRRAWFWVLLGAGLLYGIHSRSHFVGFFGDDARDLLAAQSMVHGGYFNLQDFDHPPLNFPLPGFPLLLAPFVALVQPHWAWMKALPIAATLVSGLLFWSLLEGWVGRRTRVLLVLLFLFNPTTLILSSLLIADTFFICLMLAVFWY